MLPPLVERVLTDTPPGKEEGKADGLKGACEGADGNRIEWALLSDDLGDELYSKSAQSASG